MVEDVTAPRFEDDVDVRRQEWRMEVCDFLPSACDSTPLAVRRRNLLPDAESPGSLNPQLIS